MKRLEMNNQMKKHRPNTTSTLDVSKGLGDDIDNILAKTGIKTIVKAVFGDDCGCEERKAWLNKKFPSANCLTETEHDYLKYWFGLNKESVTFVERKRLIEISNRIFKLNQKNTSCSPCVRKIVENLREIFNEY